MILQTYIVTKNHEVNSINEKQNQLATIKII